MAKAPTKTEPKKLGRPTAYPPEVWDEIIDRHSHGETVTAICKSNRDKFPTNGWVSRTAADDPVFGKRLARAKNLYADAVFEECQEIADEAAHPVMVPAFTKDGQPVMLDGKHVLKVDLNATKARALAARLRVDTRFKTIAIINPLRYATRMNIQHSGSIDMAGVDDAALNSRIERKLFELGVIDWLRKLKLAEGLIGEFLAFFRVTELPTSAAEPRLLPGEKEIEL